MKHEKKGCGGWQEECFPAVLIISLSPFSYLSPRECEIGLCMQRRESKQIYQNKLDFSENFVYHQYSLAFAYMKLARKLSSWGERLFAG